jgi:hypothetical protein
VAPVPAVASISGCAKLFYGTMVGPWWYRTATSVPRLRNPPFSALRLLIKLTRKPSCQPGSLFHQPVAEALAHDGRASYSAFFLLHSRGRPIPLGLLQNAPHIGETSGCERAGITTVT